jgi:hypothetical protein
MPRTDPKALGVPSAMSIMILSFINQDTSDFLFKNECKSPHGT